MIFEILLDVFFFLLTPGLRIVYHVNDCSVAVKWRLKVSIQLELLQK